MGQAPTDEEVNLIAVMSHRIIGGISLGNNPANEFSIVQDEIFRGNLMNIIVDIVKLVSDMESSSLNYQIIMVISIVTKKMVEMSLFIF